LFQKSQQNLERFVLQMKSSAVLKKFAGFYTEFERTEAVARQTALLEGHKLHTPDIRMLRDMEDYPGAASAYRKALLQKPDYGAAHCEPGVVLTKQGRFEEAIGHYGAALLPAKLKDLSDNECLTVAQNQIEKMLGKRRARVAEDLVTFHRVKHRSKKQLVAANGASGQVPETPKPVEQAVLRDGSH
jgi:tetratricopeptide (TPR) repeat protein